jgi:predicted TIM-barrel fold metal-dependent hydrolase
VAGLMAREPHRAHEARAYRIFLVKRRSFIAGGAALALPPFMNSAADHIPVIDAHIHLFDTNRPGGVPWPNKDDAALYKPALPDRYRRIAEPFGVVGAIEVEASPLIEDNQWVLDVAAKDKIIVGTVGHLEPGEPHFRRDLDRFHRNPLFRGIRYGNLWERDINTELKNPEFLAGIKALAAADLSLDTANPTPRLMADILRVSDAVPNLRIVIDHLPQLAPQSYESDLRRFESRPQIYVKISEVFAKTADGVSFMKDRVDQLFGVFGENRVLYGSDWPNSDHWAPYEKGFTAVHDYFMAKGRGIAEKYFWRNSATAYKWVRRDDKQPKV